MDSRSFAHGEVWIRGTDCSEHLLISIDDTHVTTMSPPPPKGAAGHWDASWCDDAAGLELPEGPSFGAPLDGTAALDSWYGKHGDFFAEFIPAQPA